MQIAHEENWIRDRAYAIWEQEGRPAGRERQHWFQAACEVVSGGPAEKPVAKARAAMKSASAKRGTTRPRKTDA